MEVVQATVEQDQNVRLNWFPSSNPLVMLVFLERSLNKVDWDLIAQFSPGVTTFADATTLVHEQSYYYRLSYLDSCGDVSALSNLGRSILLEANLQGNAPFLSWNSYTEWEVAVDHYEIEVFDSSIMQWQFVSNVAGNELEFADHITRLDQPIYCYRTRGIELAGNQSFSLSNVACVPVGPLLFAPNAFTPNGDGMNETFFLKGRFVADYYFRMFNRWGELIFESSSLEDGWDGTLHGKPSPEGVYVWVAIGRGFDGSEISLRGTATLYR